MVNRFQVLGFIEDNFLQLKLVFDGPNPNKMSDVPSMTADNLWAQIGGVLSLWLGTNIVLLVEIVELVYQFVRHVIENRKSKISTNAVSA